MALSPTYGTWLPNYLNACNSASPTGQQDAQGNNIPTPMTAGKVIQVGPGEITGLTAPGTTLYEGAYQWVNLDSGATAAAAVSGNAAYLRVDSNSIPYPCVTTYDKVTAQSATGLLAGVFLNPATLNGASNLVTPGNWCMIFVGQGRVKVNLNAAGGTPAVGDVVNADGVSDAKFTSTNTATIVAGTLGISTNVPSTGSGAIVRATSRLSSIPN